MHLAMDDLISELKNVSGEKELVQKKEEMLKKNLQQEDRKEEKSITGNDLKTWQKIYKELKEILNEHSFRSFIEPVKLIEVKGNLVTLSAPADSLSWIKDHYLEHIEETYREKTGKNISVEIE